MKNRLTLSQLEEIYVEARRDDDCAYDILQENALQITEKLITLADAVKTLKAGISASGPKEDDVRNLLTAFERVSK